MKISDPFRWLENAESTETKKWIREQNNYLDKHLRNDRFTLFSKELQRDFGFTHFSNPLPVHGLYFYTERKPKEDQAALYLRKGLRGKPIKLIDPNGKSRGNTTTLDFWSPSKSGRYLAYGLSQAGEEMAVIRIRDIKSGKDLKEKIPQCRYSQVEWLPDDSGFFYTRHPWPGTVAKNDEHLYEKVYFHALGKDPKNDPLIFGEMRPKDDMLEISLSPDGTLLAIGAAQNWTRNDLYLYECASQKTSTLIKGIEAKFSLTFLEDRAIIFTNHKADRYRVLWTPLKDIRKPIDEWKELIPESKDILQSITPTKTLLIAEYLKNVSSQVVLFTHSGKKVGTLPLPPHSSLSGIGARREEEEFFYGVESFTFPKITYRKSQGKAEVYRKTENPIDPKEYVVKQEWSTSKDGTRVPLFIYHKKGLAPKKPHPTILYGYGGFGVSLTPTFMRTFVPWIKRGGIFALANIRGGGEFGEEWHKAGTKDRKQNSFDDFIAAGEYLIKKKYTDAQHLGILGGSNGGLLVAAALTQRPDLWKAVCSKVPLTDMVRFPLFGMALRWVHEYGNPEKAKDLKNILKWSPYHNVKPGTEYPTTLFTTAVKDTRVDPLHARKMGALLQKVNEKNPIFIFTEMDAGHGPGRPVKKIVEGQALTLSFFAENLALKI